MKSILFFVTIASVLPTTISGMAGLYGKQRPFSDDELAMITIFNPRTCKRVPAPELLGTKAYNNFSGEDAHKEGWVPVADKQEMQRGDVVLVRQNDNSAVWGIIFNIKYIYLNRKNPAKPLIVEGISETPYPIQDLQEILVDIQMARNYLENIPLKSIKEFKISSGV